MFCSNCGERIDSVVTCPKCGFIQPANTEPSQATEQPMRDGPAQTTNEGTAQAQTIHQSSGQGVAAGMAENIAGALAYVFGWISGIVFLLIDKRPFVRFHAMQSIIATGSMMLISFILNRVFWRLFWRAWFIFGLFLTLFNIAILAMAVFLIYQAYQNKKFKLPIIGDLAEKLVSKVP